MFEGLVQSTTVPVLEQLIQFSQARQALLAGNIANLDTPGYQARDLSLEDFQTRLREALKARDVAPGSTSPGEMGSVGLGDVAEDTRTILRHDEGRVGLERQVSEMVKNQMQHNMALALMNSQFRLLQAAISERV